MPITLTSDGATHLRRRRILQRPVMPGSLKLLGPRLEAEAAQLVASLANGEEHEAMTQFASHLFVHVVSDLIGPSPAGREAMLAWAAASFDLMGPMNDRGAAAVPQVTELTAFVDGLTPGHAAAIIGFALKNRPRDMQLILGRSRCTAPGMAGMSLTRR
ncbi:cytochrome P450 [Sphingopyxis panaciterrae]|uniref:hypothetical protein n=1 Tax=Sphingopyxis panaciterrae TaxID=363841 RepID=UPI00141FE369|nr:hypothetical protein [Sphingopyxis panaciterrae]NIJ38274.1 cytochrome P450 [Sphingopyxis panaciterrae]